MRREACAIGAGIVTPIVLCGALLMSFWLFDWLFSATTWGDDLPRIPLWVAFALLVFHIVGIWLWLYVHCRSFWEKRTESETHGK